ncbi:MAG: hypothetical protein ACRBC3_01910 [Burkholderiaceae bacterium]
MLSSLYLTPLTGALIVVVTVLCGHWFRRAWKEQGPRWQRQAWLFGVLAATGLLTLAFVPLKF